ncbi:MAG TPA: NAD(P)-dependent oxidoreductase [Elusimicrobiota bacterium]|nr:NAD(P)-dependent oxidoreductase [Elusimicrobiota bacterium]
MKILVTGGAGYIGSILVPALLRDGHDVCVVDNFMYGQASLLDCCHHENFTLIRGDARDKALMAEQVKRADVIIPLACLTGAPLSDKDPIAARTTTLDAILMLLELRGKGQRILYPTTNSGYGIGEKGIYCDENTPLRPVSLYGRLKVDAEKAILDSGNALTFRLATAFGVSPRMRLDLLVNDFVYRAVNDGFVVLFEADFKRNYIHVRDIARAFQHGLENFDKMKDQSYNVGLSDCNLSKRELCAEIKKQLPKFYYMEAPLGEDPDKRDYIVSNAKIEASGYKPEFALARGIGELIKGYRSVKRNQYANI